MYLTHLFGPVGSTNILKVGAHKLGPIFTETVVKYTIGPGLVVESLKNCSLKNDTRCGFANKNMSSRMLLDNQARPISRGYNIIFSASLRSAPKKVPLYEGIQIPTQPKLPIVQKVPALPPGIRAIKMPLNLREIRGEEEIHNNCIHGQFCIVALRGGFLKYGHFDMMRMGIGRWLDPQRMFAIWRVDAPWKAKTKKSVGKRMGGGKGKVHHYLTPVKAKRVILEVAGKCTFREVKRMLIQIAHKLPFPATVMSQKMIEDERRKEEEQEKLNKNPFTFKYVLQNNMLGSRFWAKKFIDMKYFGKYD